MLHPHLRPARRHSLWLRKHRRPISLGLAVLIVGTSAIALTVSGASPAATWNLPYPQTMSYRVLSEDRAIQCTVSDSGFRQEIAAEGLDRYEIDIVDGHRGQCGRTKAEQFKRLYPDKMLLEYQGTGGGDPRDWPGGTWAGYYLMMNRTTAVGSVSASQTVIPVANPALFSVGDTVVMWSPAGGDPYANSEWVTVVAISGSLVTVTRNIFATGAHAYASAPFIAAEATGPGYPDPVINFSDLAPINPASGMRANEWMADNIVGDFAPSTAGAPTLDGVELDTASWSPAVQNSDGTIKNLDCNGDGVIDYCNENVGTSQQVDAYGVGYDTFIRDLKQGLTVYDTDPTRPPKMVLADGEIGLRSIDSADGAEFESYPTWDNYTYSSPALDTLGVWAAQDTAPGPHLSYTFTKDITPVYPQVSSINPSGCVTPAEGGTCRNGSYRYGMASALLTGSANAYDNEDNFLTPQPWDEDGTVDQATTGLTPGYLGQPTGPVTRTTRYSSGNLVINPSFEQDLTAVTTSTVVPGALTVAQDTSTAAPGSGSAALRADVTAQTADPQRADARVFSGVTGALATGEYTIDFWAKAQSNTAGPQALPMGVGLTGVAGAPDVILLTNNWTHYYLQTSVTTDVAKNANVKFSLGAQIGTYWLDGVNLHSGTAGIMTREFTNGIVVLNDSTSTQTNVPLTGGDYRHINGVQDTSVNDGTDVGAALPAIAAKDGEVLLRDAVTPPTSTTTAPTSTSTTAPGTTTTTAPGTTTTTAPGTTTTSVPPAVVSAGGVRAANSAGGVSVSWSPPPYNGFAVTSYTVSAFPGTRTVTVAGTQTQAMITGLAAGAYTFRVRVSQLVGTSPWSAASNSVIIAALRPPPATPRSGYWMLGSDGRVYAFGDAKNSGSAAGPAVAIAARLDGNGYWTTNWAGDVTHLGTAGDHGGHPALRPGEVVSTISATPSGNGYWLFTNRGRVFPYGDAQFYGDMTGTTLNGPIVASVATSTGHGYYLVGSDGGVFSFGDASFHGSTGGIHLNQPIVGISPTPDNRGYWLVASDGGVFAFAAPFRGSMGASHLNKAVNGLVAYGNGYLMVASDGGIFDFSNKAFGGSLADDPPTAPILGVAAFAT